jgi:hypothetical protein
VLNALLAYLVGGWLLMVGRTKNRSWEGA